MGRLYDCCKEIQEHIERRGLDQFRTRGELALEAGFLISLIGPDEPDDPEKIQALRAAALKLLGIHVG